jgi:hypothetical protein
MIGAFSMANKDDKSRPGYGFVPSDKPSAPDNSPDAPLGKPDAVARSASAANAPFDPATLPRTGDPELDAMNNHPAIRQYFELMGKLAKQPGGFKNVPPTSFRRIIADYEEQKARLSRLQDKFKWLADNPPLKETGRPRELSSISYALQPKTNRPEKITVRINIQIPATADAHIRERLLFKTTAILDSLFQYNYLPPASEISRHFMSGMEAEIQELGIPVFRFDVFEPQIDEPDIASPKPPLI